MLRAFNVGFQKVYKSCLLLLVAFPGFFVWTVASLNVPAMIVCEVARKVTNTKLFPQHNIADLNPGITVLYIKQLLQLCI